MSEQSTRRALHEASRTPRESLDLTIAHALLLCAQTVEDASRIEADICQHFKVTSLDALSPEAMAEAQRWVLSVWTTRELEGTLRNVFDRLNSARADVQLLFLQLTRQRTLLAKYFPRVAALLLIVALAWPSVSAARPQQLPPSVAPTQPVDLTDLPANTQPLHFASMDALESELAVRGLSTFYDSAATRAELEPVGRVNQDCLNGRTPSEDGKQLVAETVARITPGILALGGTFYPDVDGYFGRAFTNDCIMKFDPYTQTLLAGYGSPAMLVQIDPNVLGGGVATMIFYKATGEAQFLYYSLAMQHITNNVMRLDHPAVERESVINDALRAARLCLDYKSELLSRSEGNRNCPFCDLCKLCFNNVVGDANKKFNLLKAGIEAGVAYGSIEKCATVKTFLYRAGCLLAVLWGRKIALNTIAEDYNQSVRDKLEQCKKDIAELTKDLPGGIVRCEYRETPQ